MEIIVALGIGVLTGSGVWLLLRPRTFQVIIGLSLLSYAVNLFIFSTGGLRTAAAPVLERGVQAVEECVTFIVEGKDPRATFAGAVPFLKLMGIVAGGWQMARAALAAEKMLDSGDKAFCEAKIATGMERLTSRVM